MTNEDKPTFRLERQGDSAVVTMNKRFARLLRTFIEETETDGGTEREIIALSVAIRNHLNPVSKNRCQRNRSPRSTGA